MDHFRIGTKRHHLLIPLSHTYVHPSPEMVRAGGTGGANRARIAGSCASGSAGRVVRCRPGQHPGLSCRGLRGGLERGARRRSSRGVARQLRVSLLLPREQRQPLSAELPYSGPIAHLPLDLRVRSSWAREPRVFAPRNRRQPVLEVRVARRVWQHGAIGAAGGAVEVFVEAKAPGGAPEVDAEALVLVFHAVVGLEEGLVDAVALGAGLGEHHVEGCFYYLGNLRTQKKSSLSG